MFRRRNVSLKYDQRFLQKVELILMTTEVNNYAVGNWKEFVHQNDWLVCCCMVCNMRTLFTTLTNDHIKTDDLLATATKVQRYKRYAISPDNRTCISVVLINTIEWLKQRAQPGETSYKISPYWCASLADITLYLSILGCIWKERGRCFRQVQNTMQTLTQLRTPFPEKSNNIPQDLRVLLNIRDNNLAFQYF